MKILFLPNWQVHSLDTDTEVIQAPDKQVFDKPYWFFKYFNVPCQVDVIDFQPNNPIRSVERKCNVYIWQAFKAFWKMRDYDVIISHGAQSGLMLSWLRTITMCKKTTHIIFDIGSMNGARQNVIENRVIKWMLGSQPYIICHSKVIIDNYKTTYRQLVDRTSFIPFGVDVDDFKPQDTAVESDYVLSFGAAKRDYTTLLSAWSGINTTAKLRIIGYSHAVTDVDNVETIKKVSISELKYQIANARFVVIPLPVFNYSYGQMSFLQSMAMGKAVIVTNTPSSVDYIVDGVGAILVKPYDAQDLRENILKLLHDADLLARVSAQSRTFVLDHFSEKQMAISVEQFILQAIAANKGELQQR